MGVLICMVSVGTSLRTSLLECVLPTFPHPRSLFNFSFLGAELCLGLVSDTQRSRHEKGHPALNPTLFIGSTDLGPGRGCSVRLRGTHCRGMPSEYLQFLANAAQEVNSRPEFLTLTTNPGTRDTCYLTRYFTWAPSYHVGETEAR